MQKIYYLYHIRNEDTDDEDVKLIGMYSSYELAEKAQERTKYKPGFIDYPDDFQIFDDVINRDGWVEGFIT